MASAPRVIAAAGLHASASTWVFNVVRELMISAAGASLIRAVYAETVAELPPDDAGGTHLIIKSHHGSTALDAWLSTHQARIILSIRDPRDACLSMSQRFRAPLDHSAQWLGADCERMMRLAAAGHPVLRYEDRFFEGQQALPGLAQALNLTVAPAVIAAIAERYTSEAVRAFARDLAGLSSDRLLTVAPGHLMDRVTQIHSPHIGDTRSGKWRELPSPISAALTHRFGAFLDYFGYARR
jgi:hypothetical protein